jgi:hypothetical protein
MAACPDPSTQLVADDASTIGAMGIDATNIYFLRPGKGIYGVPKAGGDVKTLFSGDRFLLTLKTEMLADADNLYFARTEGIYKMPLAGGEPTVWVKGTLMDQTIAMDADYVYFADDTEDMDGVPHGSISKANKSDGSVTLLTKDQPGPTGIILSGDTLYWQNVGSSSGLLQRANDGGLSSIGKSGGSAKTLFAVPADGSGIQLAGSLADLATDGTYLYFPSLNLSAVDSSGAFKVPVGGGTPSKLAGTLTVGAFVVHGGLYVDNGDRIVKLALSDGAETNLACFADPLNGSVMMLHDDSDIYFAKDDGDPGHAIRKLAY